MEGEDLADGDLTDGDLTDGSGDLGEGTRDAVYPGSFDPVTRGHLDLIERGLLLFERLTIGVLDNPQKRGLFSVEERAALLRAELGKRPVEVVAFDGLAADFAVERGAAWILRGLRSSEDAGYELPMALSNRLCGRRRVETIFLPSAPQVAFVSSRLVREIAASKGRLEAFVTPAVEAALREKCGD